MSRNYMLEIGISIGIFSYYIFSLGLFHVLYPPVLVVSTLIYVILLCIIIRPTISIHKLLITLSKETIFNTLLLEFILIQAGINFVGVVGPELAFDALWYHLSIPKMYLLYHSIYYIPGNLLYYNTLPRLTEILYIPTLSLGLAFLPKFLHFSFGLLCCFLTYKIARLFSQKTYALLVVIIFYSNLVVGWESIAAYNDLVRTFFELLTFFAFIKYYNTKKIMYIILSALFFGFAICTKYIAIGTLGIIIPLLVYLLIIKFHTIRQTLVSFTLYVLSMIIIPLPYYIFSILYTHNPIYPIFSSNLQLGQTTNIFPLPAIINTVYTLFLHAADPISPIYLAIIPLLFVVKYKKSEVVLLIYSVFAFLVWYITPQIGGGRFILPYLPVWSILTVITISKIKINYQKAFIMFIILISLVNILYRGIANAKYLPFIFGHESKTQFLTKHLNFSFGDFVDSDEYFQKHITPKDTVLLLGFHNLYYINFPFIDSSWRQTSDTFNYVATQNTILPKEFNSWHKVYQNDITHVTLYKK